MQTKSPPELGAYKWEPAVSARADLRLVDIDEDPRVSERATSTIALYDTLVNPADGLLVNEVDSRIWSGLRECTLANPSTPHLQIAAPRLYCFTRSEI